MPYLLLQSSDLVRGVGGCLGGTFGLLVGIALYLFFCYCAKLICIKAGKDPGILIWIPIAQFVPMFQAAGLNPLLIIGLFIPLVNIVVVVMLWWKLAEALRKPGWLGILMLIPPINIGVILYLAFAD